MGSSSGNWHQEPVKASSVNSIAVCGTNVFVTGSFVSPDYSLGGLFRFDTSGTRLTAPGLYQCYYNDPGAGNALAVCNGKVYVAGSFDRVGSDPSGVQATNIAQWDGTVWSPLGGGLTDPVSGLGGSALCVAADSTAVYVLGLFWQAGPIGAYNGARWLIGNDITKAIAHSAAVKYDGTVWTWGGNLGNGTATTRSTPGQVGGLSGIIGVSTGDSSTFVWDANGKVWAWGDNRFGELGDGSTVNRLSPVPIPLPPVVRVSGGEDHGLALQADGTVWAWGDNTYGQIGNGTQSMTPVGPTHLTTINNVIDIAAGAWWSLALTSDGKVWAWGYNDFGQLGDGTTGNCKTTPKQVPVVSNVIGIAAGYGGASLAVESNGSVWAWGYNYYGQIGDGTTTTRPSPVQVVMPAGVFVERVAEGGSHCLALDSSGLVWGWGDNSSGQLGDGTQTRRLSPVYSVKSSAWAADIAAGSGFSMLIAQDLTLDSWGSNVSGQLGNGTTTTALLPVIVLEF